jgi:hypothetical protein
MLEPVSFLIGALIVPYVILLSGYIAGKRKKLRMRLEAAKQADMISELQETEV